MKAVLHFGTFMACYSNFSQGVLHEKFFSTTSKKLSDANRKVYSEMYLMYRGLKLKKNEAEAQKVTKQLYEKYEKDLRIDVILMARDAETERFFGEKGLQA